MKTIFAGFILAATTAIGSHAALITEPTRVFTTPAIIADLQDPPEVFSEVVTDSLVYFITSVEVGVRLVGVDEGSGFASEMYVSLTKDLGATSVLLNQVGVSPLDSLGSFYDGWDVTFSDGAANGDIHASNLAAGILQGIWQPDGRVDAASSNRPAMLSVFNGGSGNGKWSLAVADLELGGQMRLESWTLKITGLTEDGPVAVPEARASFGACVLGALTLLSLRRWQIKRN